MADFNQLEVKLLGTPSVLLNHAPVNLPYRQTQALLYYLLVNKKGNKETLADLIWGDKCQGQKISSNLRNALYILRKYLGKDFIKNDVGELISIDPNLQIVMDIEQFLSESGSVALYDGEFLEGFYLKNNTLYNDWVERTRQYLKNVYLNKLHSSIIQEYETGNSELCEELCHKQLELNEFDETAYQYLMKIYQQRKNYSLALKLYHQLEKLFLQELFEKPGKETRELALSIEETLNSEISLLLENKKETAGSDAEQDIFYGRKEELDRLQNIFSEFMREQPFKHALLTGEAGIGKTALAEQFLHFIKQSVHKASPGNQPVLCLKMRCYYAEERYILKPWQAVARKLLEFLKEQHKTEEHRFLIQGITGLFPFLETDSAPLFDTDDIGTMDYKSLQSIFVNSLLHFSTKQPFVLYIDDIQWSDEISLSMIRDILTSSRSIKGCRLLFLMTCRNNPGAELQRLFDTMYSLELFDIIPLHRFNFQETVSLASRLLPDYHFTNEARNQLFHETEGNVFFIKEAVQNIKYNGSPEELTPNMRNIIEQRIAPLPDECYQILNLVSIFFDGVSFKCLSAMSHKEDYILAELLETLLKQNLLKEDVDHHDTFFSFTHQKFCEYVYEKMSWTKKRILHDKAGLFYEGRLRQNLSDMALYPKLIYHFEKGSNYHKYLKYAVKYLYNYLNVTHEFFPVIEQNLSFFTMNMKEQKPELLTSHQSSIETLLCSVENIVHDQIDLFLMEETDRNEQLEIVSDYLHMTGRHYIRTCNYDKGLHYILKLKEINEAYDSPIRLNKLLQANRQLICVYINLYEPKKMTQVIQDSLKLLEPYSLPEETAVWKRLQGLCNIMGGDPDEGIRHLGDAIDIFTHSKDKEKHLYNLAAAYSWIGEAWRQTFEYEKALGYYDKAIEICSRNSLVSGISIFYAYAGMAAYDSGNLSMAEKYLQKAMSGYEHGNLMWGRSLPYSYYSLILFSRKAYDDAFSHLETARSYAAKLKNKYELGIIARIDAQIKTGLFDDEEKQEFVSSKTGGTFSELYGRAATLLKEVYSPVDQQYLRSMKT